MGTRTTSSREFNGSSLAESTPSMLHQVHPGLPLQAVLALAVWEPSAMGRPSYATAALPVSPLMVSAATKLAIGGELIISRVTCSDAN